MVFIFCYMNYILQLYLFTICFNLGVSCFIILILFIGESRGGGGSGMQWDDPSPLFFRLSYRLVKMCLNRMFPILSLSFFFLPSFVIFALNMPLYLLIFFSRKKKGSPLWKCLVPPLLFTSK